MWLCSKSMARLRTLDLGLRTFCMAAVFAAAIASSGCGYALAGHGAFLPEYIKTIGIPTFTNVTSYYAIAQIVTDKVRTEFIGRGHYQVLPDATGGDAVLVGTVTSITIVPTAFGANQQASHYAITMTASIELRDARQNTILWSNPGVTVRDEYDASGTVSSTNPAVDPAAFFNQESDAVARVSTDFARTVVTAILEA